MTPWSHDRERGKHMNTCVSGFLKNEQELRTKMNTWSFQYIYYIITRIH